MLKKELDKGLQEQLDFMKKFKIENTQFRKGFDDKYNMLQAEYDELQAIFQNRPSRTEDLELIEKQKSDIQVMAAELKKAIEQLNFFKLELINREQSYNQMFNANPNVGVVNNL